MHSSPAVANGLVYAGSMDNDGHLYAVDAESGEPIWKFRGSDFDSEEGRIRSGLDPVFSRRRRRTRRFCSRDGFLYGLNAADGRENWKLDNEVSWVISSPAIAGGLVLTGTSDGLSFQATDLKTGKERWRFELSSRVFSSGSVADGVVYFGCHDGFLYALDTATGSEKWRFRTGGMIQSSPVIADGVVYVGSDDGRLYALSGAPTPDGGPRFHKAVFWQEFQWKYFQGDIEAATTFEKKATRC